MHKSVFRPKLSLLESIDCFGPQYRLWGVDRSQNLTKIARPSCSRQLRATPEVVLARHSRGLYEVEDEHLTMSVFLFHVN